MMDTWTLQMGIPLVVVERSGKQVRIRQERFLKGVLQEDPEWAALQSGYDRFITCKYLHQLLGVLCF